MPARTEALMQTENNTNFSSKAIFLLLSTFCLLHFSLVLSRIEIPSPSSHKFHPRSSWGRHNSWEQEITANYSFITDAAAGRGNLAQISRHGVRDSWNRSILSKIEVGVSRGVGKLGEVIGEGARSLFCIIWFLCKPSKIWDWPWVKEVSQLQMQWKVYFWKMQLLPVENFSSV